MMSRLQKAKKITVIQGKPGVEGRKAGCRTYKTLAGYTAGSGGSTHRAGSGVQFVWVPENPLTGREAGWESFPAPLKPSNPSGSGSATTPIYHEHQECWSAIPAVAPIPTRIVSTINNRWGDGARSIKPILAEQFCELYLKTAPTAIMIGLGVDGLDYKYNSLEHGIAVRPEGVYEIAKGVDGNLHSTRAKRIRVAREGDSVAYYANDVLVTRAQQPAGDNLYLYVLLYDKSDFVFDPVIGNIASGTAEFEIQATTNPLPMGISTFKIETNATANVDGKVRTSGTSSFAIRTNAIAYRTVLTKGSSSLLLKTDIRSYRSIYLDSNSKRIEAGYGDMTAMLGVLVATGLSASQPIAVAKGVAPPHRLTAHASRAEAIPATAEGAFPAPQINSWIISGGILSGSSSFSMIGKASQSDFASGFVKYRIRPDVGGWIDNTDSSLISSNDQVYADDYLSIDFSYLLSFVENVGVGFEFSTIDIYHLLDLSIDEALGVSSTLTLEALLELIISEQIQVSENAEIARHEALQYAVNSTTGAISRYRNFGFKQFATSGSRTYAITDTGLYELSGNDDDGEAISALIDFGASDYGTAQSKRVSSVYAGIATDGSVYFRVSGDLGEEAIYKAVSYGQESRAQTAKGIVSRHWRVRLELTDARYADLDNIEVELAVSNRRLQR